MHQTFETFFAKAWQGLLLCFVAAWLPAVAWAAEEQKFDVLQIGTVTYHDVTVTTKTKSYIFILHRDGMRNIPVADLPGDVKTQLGYVDPEAQKREAAAKMSKMVDKTLAQAGLGDTKHLKELVERNDPRKWLAQQHVSRNAAISVLAGMFGLYLLFCYCTKRICENAGTPGGVLVWIPVLQIIPQLKAAGMSGWWLLGYFLPVLNIIVPIRWCFRIAQACGKGAWTGLFLCLPVTNLFAYLYLAFSDRPAPKETESKKGSGLMVLEAA